MVEAQGGDVEYIKHPEKFEMSKNIIEVRSEHDGYIKEINALEIGISAMKLGAGRETLEDVIDMSAGIILNKKVGDPVKEGELLATLYTNKPKEVYEPIALDVLHTFEITSNYVEHQKAMILIDERIRDCNVGDCITDYSGKLIVRRYFIGCSHSGCWHGIIGKFHKFYFYRADFFCFYPFLCKLQCIVNRCIVYLVTLFNGNFHGSFLI